MPILSLISKRNSLATMLCVLLFSVAGTSAFTQDAAPQQTAPPPAPAQPNAATPNTLDALPQAPGPQHNAHPYSEEDYTRGKRQWPNPFDIYSPRDIPSVNVRNSPRLDQIVRDGKMYLSLNDAVALALSDNLDIGIQRYNLSIADTDILRTSSGAVALGVNAGLLQGTPGGTTGSTSAGGTGTSTTGATGSGVGGTSIGVGGAGSGAAGLVTSTQGEGTPIDSFDPTITGTVAIQHSVTPESNTVFTGTNELFTNTTTANFLYTQGFPTGTLMTVAFNNSRLWESAIFNTINPSL